MNIHIKKTHNVTGKIYPEYSTLRNILGKLLDSKAKKINVKEFSGLQGNGKSYLQNKQNPGWHQNSQKQHRKKIKSEKKNLKNQGRKKVNQGFYTQSRVQMSCKN